SRKEHTKMDELLDNIARILATPMPRRKALRYLGGALAAASIAVIGGRPVSATACPKPTPSVGDFTCGSGSGATCCARNECCALKGNVGTCCKRNECVCHGSCSSSTQGNCPNGCFLCAAA